ncbi:MAG: LysR family transcriptional regulator [Idiomarina sp.]
MTTDSKTNKTPSLNALRVFAAAAYAGSFKQVAQELGVSQSAITRQIQTLEEQLGTRLFQRDNRLHALTPAGQRLAPELQRIFASLNRLLEQTQSLGDEDVTTLRIALPGEWLRWWLAPQLHDFYGIYPHIKLAFSELPLHLQSNSAAQAIEQLQHEQLDIVIGCSKLRDRQIEQTPLCRCGYIPVTSYQGALELPELEWLINQQSQVWQAFSKQHQSVAKDARLTAVDSLGMAVDLLTKPQTVTLVDEHFLAHPQLQSLQQFNELRVELPQALSLFTRKRSRQPVPLVAFSKWLQARLR